jgi:hypothetical protein
VRGKPLAFWIDVAIKVGLAAILLLALVKPHLDQFEGKGMGYRIVLYPIAAAVVPVAWWIVQRRLGRPVDYPYAIDILFTLPFLVDTAGNALDLYDSISWWDDVNHLVNWFFLVAAFGQLLVRLPVGRLEAFGLAFGFGAVTAILWEFAEYYAFIRNSDELDTAYTDTLGDLALGGIAGSCIAAIVTVTVGWRRRASHGQLIERRYTTSPT